MQRNHNELYSISIDLGTSSCKMIAMNERGDVVESASSSYPTYSPHSGWAEQNPKDWIDAVIKTSITLMKQGCVERDKIAIITLTSAAHIAVLTNNQNEPIRNAILWSDQRSSVEAADLRRAYGESIERCTYNNVTTSWTLPHLVWIRKNEPEIWGLTRRVSLSKDYLAHWLTGEWRTDPATAVSSMLCDSSFNKWSEDLCDIARIESKMLPEIIPAVETVGTLIPSVANSMNLPVGIPVVNGTLDSATETYGAKAVNDGDCVVRIGTAGGIHMVTDSPKKDSQLLTYPYLINNFWYSQAGTNSAGSSISWAAKILSDNNYSGDYDLLNNLASKITPGSDGVIFHPYLAGERTPYWDPLLKGTFSGISFGHGKAHFARAVLEGVIFSIYDAFLALVGSDTVPDSICVVGGGTRSFLMMNILSTLLDRKIVILKNSDSAFGAALLGLESIDVINSENNTKGVIMNPDKAEVSIYAKAFKNYQSSCRFLQEIYQARSSIN